MCYSVSQNWRACEYRRLSPSSVTCWHSGEIHGQRTSGVSMLSGAGSGLACLGVWLQQPPCCSAALLSKLLRNINYFTANGFAWLAGSVSVLLQRVIYFLFISYSFVVNIFRCRPFITMVISSPWRMVQVLLLFLFISP